MNQESRFMKMIKCLFLSIGDIFAGVITYTLMHPVTTRQAAIETFTVYVIVVIIQIQISEHWFRGVNRSAHGSITRRIVGVYVEGKVTNVSCTNGIGGP